MAVAEPALRGRGVDGQRICDSSVMPSQIGSNTNAPTIMIGEKIADLIRGQFVISIKARGDHHRPRSPHRGCGKVGNPDGLGQPARLCPLQQSQRGRDIAIRRRPMQKQHIHLINPQIFQALHYRSDKPIRAIILGRPRSTEITKPLVNAAEGEDRARTLETLAGALVAGSDDLTEGLRAYREKRPPHF